MNTIDTTTINHALLAFRPMIARSYTNIITNRFNLIQQSLGPTFKNVYNDWNFASMYREMVAPNVTVNHETKVVTLNESKLAKNAEAYADATAASWLEKIAFKMGELESAEVKALNYCAFIITGVRNGQKVAIEQQMILNHSPKGKLFNQFPARIYVDGKATSEAKYKKLAATR